MHTGLFLQRNRKMGRKRGRARGRKGIGVDFERLREWRESYKERGREREREREKKRQGQTNKELGGKNEILIERDIYIYI